MLDNADTIFYLAATVAPWFRYSPTLPALFTRTAVATLVQEIAERGPDVVVIRSGPARILLLDAPDVWREVHAAVAAHYRLERTIDVFEFWTRKAQ